MANAVPTNSIRRENVLLSHIKFVTCNLLWFLFYYRITICLLFQLSVLFVWICLLFYDLLPTVKNWFQFFVALIFLTFSMDFQWIFEKIELKCHTIDCMSCWTQRERFASTFIIKLNVLERCNISHHIELITLLLEVIYLIKFCDLSEMICFDGPLDNRTDNCSSLDRSLSNTLVSRANRHGSNVYNLQCNLSIYVLFKTNLN